MFEEYTELKMIKDRLKKLGTLSRGTLLSKLVFKFPGMIVGKAVVSFYRKSGMSKRMAVGLFWGEELNIVLPEAVSAVIHSYGFFEEDTSYVILDRLPKGGTFIDIGAHYGYFSRLARYTVGEGGAVHSFEPTPSTYEVLVSNCEKFDNITTNNCGVWRENTKMSIKDHGVEYASLNTFHNPRKSAGGNGLDSYELVEVTLACLDDYVDEANLSPDLVKIDAEGSELEILKGFEKTIKRCHPDFVLEVGDMDGNKASKDIVMFLELHGYTAYEFQDYALVEHKLEEYYTHMNLYFSRSK